jgi:flavin-dependent dehydrogenase
MGIGYWVWIIPLSGGRTSIGLVSDPQTHPLTAYDTFDKFCDWLRRHEPLLASKVDEAAASLMDFHKLRKLSLDSKKLWSVDRWALTGEAGVFADPFYSPGTDYIALGNTFIADLITRNCSDAERSIRTRVYEKLYQSFFDSTMSLYREQYAGFGDARLMSVKTTWDYAYYWSILARMFFRQVLTDLDFLRNAESRLTRIRNLNDSVQGHFRRRAVEKRVDKGQGRFVDQIGIPILVDLNAALLKPAGPLDAELQENCARLERLAPILLDLLADRFTPTAESKSLLGDLDTRLAGTA